MPKSLLASSSTATSFLAVSGKSQNGGGGTAKRTTRSHSAVAVNKRSSRTSRNSSWNASDQLRSPSRKTTATGGGSAKKPCEGSASKKPAPKGTKVKKPVGKAKVEPKKVLGKKVAAKDQKKKTTPAKKSQQNPQSSQSSVKKEKESDKEPVEVVIHVKKEKPKVRQPSPPLKTSGKSSVISGKVKKKTQQNKSNQIKKEILQLSEKMEEKLENVVNTILEVAVVSKKVPAMKKVVGTETDKVVQPMVKGKQPSKKKNEVKFEVDVKEEEDGDKEVKPKNVQVKKEDVDELKEIVVKEEIKEEVEETKEVRPKVKTEKVEKKKSQAKTKLVKPPARNQPKKPPSKSSSSKASPKKTAKSQKSAKSVQKSQDSSDQQSEPELTETRSVAKGKTKKTEEEVEEKGSSDEDESDESEDSSTNKVPVEPRRHSRVASLNAMAKVHCLYENESRGAMLEFLDKSSKYPFKKVVRPVKAKPAAPPDDSDENDTDKQEVSTRTLRSAPGIRSVGRHYDVETSSSSSAPSGDESNDEEKKQVNPKASVKTVKQEEKNDKDKDDPTKKVRKRRKRCELMMDLKDMVVRKRMASLNASAMLAATYSVEKRTNKTGDDRKKKSSATTSSTDDDSSSTDVEPESSDDEVIVSGSSKKVAVIVNQDTDVTITGLYVNSTTRSTRHCITGMQYRISSTSHTQTESSAVTTETVIHTADHVSVSHSSSSSVEASGSPGGSCKSYTPLGALSSMQPPGNSSPLMRRHPCSSSAFSAPPYHHHQDIHGYYQPAGPLISHHLHHGGTSSASIVGSLPAVVASTKATPSNVVSGHGIVGGSDPPSVVVQPSIPPQSAAAPPQHVVPPPAHSELPPHPQDFRPHPPGFHQGYPPPPPPYSYGYIQPPYQDCYTTTYIHKYPPGAYRGYWGRPSSSQMVTSEPYPSPAGAPGGALVETFSHPGPPPPPPPPHNYYYPPPPQPGPPCYSHSPPTRTLPFMDPSFQSCPCPMQACPKNVLTGPLTGASKGSSQNVQAQTQQQMVQVAAVVVDTQQQPSTQQPTPLPPVALALSLEPNGASHGPPSPARGSAGAPPPASPALSTARNPPSWSPPNLTDHSTIITTCKKEKDADDSMEHEPSLSPVHHQTLVSDSPPPVLENQVQIAARPPRPPKRKPSIEPEVDPPQTTPTDLTTTTNSDVTAPPASKRRRSSTPVTNKTTVEDLSRGQKKDTVSKSIEKTLLLASDKKAKTKITVTSQLTTKTAPLPKVNCVLKTVTSVNNNNKLAIVPKVNGLKQLSNAPAVVTKTTCVQKKVEIVACRTKVVASKTNGVKALGQSKPNGVRQKRETTKKNSKSDKKGNKKQQVELKDSYVPSPLRTHPTLRWSNGWSWEGEPYKAKIFLTCDDTPVMRKCYPAMRHIEGDIIYPRDSILLKSGPRKQQLPFVAKVASMWENPEDGEMMVSLLWYYRPEHTEQGRDPRQPDDEIFASRHKDTNSVACIEDKCFVLTYNEYCRYKKSTRAAEYGVSLDSRPVVPSIDNAYPRTNRLPRERIANELLFFCRKVYDFRTKRLLKNPN